jgi:hypothetical protein
VASWVPTPDGHVRISATFTTPSSFSRVAVLATPALAWPACSEAPKSVTIIKLGIRIAVEGDDHYLIDVQLAPITWKPEIA